MVDDVLQDEDYDNDYCYECEDWDCEGCPFNTDDDWYY